MNQSIVLGNSHIQSPGVSFANNRTRMFPPSNRSPNTSGVTKSSNTFSKLSPNNSRVQNDSANSSMFMPRLDKSIDRSGSNSSRMKLNSTRESKKSKRK